MIDRKGNPMRLLDSGTWVGAHDCWDGERWRPTDSIEEIMTARLIRVQLHEQAIIDAHEAEFR